MKTYEVCSTIHVNITATPEEFKEGFIVKLADDVNPITTNPNEFSRPHIRIYCEKKKPPKKMKKVKKLVAIEPTIPDHPNCHYGDCDKLCLVYDCGINQGYNEIPRLPDDYEPEYEEREVEVPVDEDE